MVPEAATSPELKLWGYPRSIIAGIIMTPIARAVATLDPQMAAKTMLHNTQTIANPPGRNPTIALAAFMRYLEDPPLAINSAAITKNGMAISGKEARALYMISGIIRRGVPEKKPRVIKEVIPRTKTIGIPLMSRAKNINP
jgi:hypothetical protein